MNIFSKKHLFQTLLLLACGLACFTGARAQDNEVNVIGTGTVKVKVEGLGGSQGSEATRVLAADLRRTLLITPSEAGERFVVRGTAGVSDVTGQLVEKSSGAVVLNKTYTGGWRKAVHQFADDVTLKATGVAGFATARVAFISKATGAKELYVMDIDGANLVQQTKDRSISNGPAWSADQSRIAYTSYKSGYPDVYIVDLSKGARKRVAFFPGINSGAAFSPDGGTLALTLSRDGNPELYVMPSGGGSPTRLTRTRGSETSPSWSPSGDRIAFTSDDRGSPQLFVIPASGGKAERLPVLAGYVTEPDWSPDGKKIAFTMRAGGQFYIGVLDLETRKSQQVSMTPGEDPSWTHNSRHLVYTSGGALRVLDTVSKQNAKLECGVAVCTEPSVTR